MSNSLPTLSSLAPAVQVPLPTSTAVERIYAASIEEANGTGVGLAGLSQADKVMNHQMETAYALILNYHSFDQAWPLLAKQFGISRATCYRRLADAQNLMGDLKKVKKEGRRSVLLDYARKLLQLSLSQRPPDVKSALAAMKFEANLSGLLRADAHGEDEGTGTGNTSYVLNLTVEGRKSRQFDLTRPDQVSDADWEFVEEAISQDVVSAEGMQLLMTEAKEGGGKL